MLSYRFSIKTLFPVIVRNNNNRSGNESHLRGRVFLNNSRRVTAYRVRVTKLILRAYLLLDNNSITCNGLLRLWFFAKIYKKSSITNLEPLFTKVYGKQRPKYVFGGILGTMGYPKERKFYGIGDSVRGSDFRCFSFFTDINVKSCVGLKELMKVNKNNFKCVNNKLIHIISDIKVLMLAFKVIKNNPKNIDLSINYSVSIGHFKKVSNLLRSGKFMFTFNSKIFSLKKNHFSNFIDLLVQQAIFFVLNAILEPRFFNFAHGFRPNKNAHSALKNLKNDFKNVKWCLNYSIDNRFLLINYKTIPTMLKKRIVCGKFLSLINRFFKDGYLIDESTIFISKVKSIQNFTGPVLINLYYHQIDLFFLDIIEFSMFQIKKDVKFFHFRENPRKLLNYSNFFFESSVKYIHYIRYLNSFIVGMKCFYGDSKKICKKIDLFLASKLKMSLKKNLILKLGKNIVFFLGTFITIKEINKNLLNLKKKIRIIIFKAPLKLIFEKYLLKGFFKKREGEFVPVYVGECINLTYSKIFNFYIKSLNSIFNYYSFVENKKSLNKLVYGFKLSFIRTLALKYKLRHASKVYKKFGSELKFFTLYVKSKSSMHFCYNITIPKEIFFKRK